MAALDLSTGKAIGNSHYPDTLRVEQQNWDKSDLDLWSSVLLETIQGLDSRVVLVAHSLACSLIAHCANQVSHQVAGALLVCPADVDLEQHTPDEVRGFAPMPLMYLWSEPNISPNAGVVNCWLSALLAILTSTQL